MKQVTSSSLTKKQAIDLIWSQTHRDFRGMSDGKRTIMVSAKFGGGLCAIEHMEKAMFDEYLDLAISSKNAKTCKSHAANVFLAHPEVFSNLGLTEDSGTVNQSCGTFDGIRELVTSLSKYDLKEVINQDRLAKIMHSIDAAESEYLA